MKLPDALLFVGAHCDDIELFAGGLLARACRDGARVGVLVFSDHRGVLDEAQAAQARGEFRDNLAWLAQRTGASIEDHSPREMAGWMRACRGDFEAQRGAIYAALEALRGRYPLVVTHAASDTNQDHRQVALEAARVFKAHATLLGGEFPNNDLGAFSPQVYVPLLPEDLEAKARMVTAYRSQRLGGRPYLDEDGVRALACVRGRQVREPFAEAFEVAGRVIVRDAPPG